MGGIFKKPKAPEPDKALEAARAAELKRTESERLQQIQSDLAGQTRARSGTGKKSLLTRGTSGFSIRSLLGG